MTEHCESTRKEWSWRIVQVKTGAREENRQLVSRRAWLVIYVDGRLWQSKSQMDRPIIREWWESGGPTPSGVVLWSGRRDRERARAQYGGVAAALQRSSAPLDKRRRIPSRHGTMAAVCGFVVTLLAQSNERLSLTRRSRINQLRCCWILAAQSMF